VYAVKGLELHRAFFEECALPILRDEFPEELPVLAIGSVGFGSERWRADDELSRDHCWEPGFHLFSAELDKRVLSTIEDSLYEKLPWEFRGHKRSGTPHSVSAIRSWTVDEFFASMTSFTHPPADDLLWLRIPEEALFHATNGEVFYDPSGDLTRRRDAFSHYPENVWRFKLACRAYRADVRRYELERALTHGEPTAAEFLLADGLREVMRFTFLVNRQHAPYDRWLPWAFRRLEVLSPDIEPLVVRIYEGPGWPAGLALYQDALEVCKGWATGQGFVSGKQACWEGIWEGVEGPLAELHPGLLGVEYAYGSQFAIGDHLARLWKLWTPAQDG
jgi:hypothetical protein